MFKGNQPRNDSSYAVHDLYSMDTYYWRVDEIDTTIAIDTIRSKNNGDSLLSQTYDHIDSNALSTQSYYHVVQFFNDGRSRPSEIRSVKGYSKVPVLKVWPVPSSGESNKRWKELGSGVDP